MKKILIVTSTYYFIRAFLIPHIKHLVESGYIVHVASAPDGTVVPYAHKQIDIPVERTPFHGNNLKAIGLLSDLIAAEKYHLLYCHTPMGAYVSRMAVRKARATRNIQVVYMAHGFHFYKGAPLANWLLFYPAEKYLARYTDAIITINREDKITAERRLSCIGRQYNLPGIGYDRQHIGDLASIDKAEARRLLGLREDDFVLLYIAWFCKRKNHEFLISALPDLLREIPQCKMLFLGDGALMERCRRYADRLGVGQSTLFLGYQSPIGTYLKAADVGISSSVWEGLPLNIIEEMYAAMPIVASRVRGHVDLIVPEYNGFLFDLNDRCAFVRHIVSLQRNPELRAVMGRNAKNGIEKYSVENVLPLMQSVYDECWQEPKA